ncbi:MAG: DUF2079 domain-containing protein [Parcubacteria group bacterium]|nr:DUF2079 domain-containing protein [Parcubacteria group bacterium]
MKYLLIIMGVYAGIFSVLAVRNHQLYQTFGWDLGFFDQLLWQASRGNLNFVSTVGNVNILGDHFQPIIYLMAPLYWIWDDVKVILIAQTLLVTAAAIPIYKLAKFKLKNEILAISVSFAYLLFGGTQFTITNEFHQSAFIPLLLSLGLWWMETAQTGRGLAALFSLLLVREEMGLLVAALGVMYFRRKDCPLLMVSGGIIGFFLLIRIVIPAISSQGQYIHYGYGSFGDKPEEVLISAIKSPGDIASSLISPPVKVTQVFQSLASFGGLPLLSPVSLIPVFEQYAVRFLDDRNIHRWLNNNHYSAPLGPLLAYGTILNIVCFENFLGSLLNFHLAAYLIVISVTIAIVLKTPIWSIFKPQLYFTPQWVKDADNLVLSVPSGASVAVNNSLAPHLTHRDKLYLLPEVGDAEYIAVDLADGPNKHAPWTAEKMREYIDGLVDGGDWEVQQRFGESLLLIKRRE